MIKANESASTVETRLDNIDFVATILTELPLQLPEL